MHNKKKVLDELFNAQYNYITNCYQFYYLKENKEVLGYVYKFK